MMLNCLHFLNCKLNYLRTDLTMRQKIIEMEKINMHIIGDNLVQYSFLFDY